MNKTILCLLAGLFTFESLAQEIELSYKVDGKPIPISDNWYYDIVNIPEHLTPIPGYLTPLWDRLRLGSALQR